MTLEPGRGERVLEPLVDQALVRGVLIDDHHRGARLGDDVGLVQLRAGGPERPVEQVGRRRLGGRPRVGAGRGQAFERGLHGLGETARQRAALREAGRGTRRELLGGRLGAAGPARQGGDGPGSARSGGAVARRLQRLAQGAGDEGTHAAGVAEAHLGLARVHVDVDLARGECHVERKQRVARLGQQIAVG